MLSKAVQRSVTLISRSITPAASTLLSHQRCRFTIYTGYGKASPDLEAIHDRWTTLYNTRDADQLCDLYTQDCTIMPAGEESITGQSNAKKYFAKHLNQVSQIVAHLDEAAPMDKDSSMAFIRGTYTYLNIGDLDNVVDDGKNVMILKKVDGEWKVYVDIWSSNHSKHDE